MARDIKDIRAKYVDEGIDYVYSSLCATPNIIVYVTDGIIVDVANGANERLLVLDYVTGSILDEFRSSDDRPLDDLCSGRGHTRVTNPIDENGFLEPSLTTGIDSVGNLISEEAIDHRLKTAKNCVGLIFMSVGFLTMLLKAKVPTEFRLNIEIEEMKIVKCEYAKQEFHTVVGMDSNWGIRRKVNIPHDFHVDYLVFANHSIGVHNRHRAQDDTIISSLPYPSVKVETDNQGHTRYELFDESKVSFLDRTFAKFVIDSITNLVISKIDASGAIVFLKSPAVTSLISGFAAYQDYSVRFVVNEANSGFMGITISDINLRYRCTEDTAVNYLMKKESLGLDRLNGELTGCILMGHTAISMLQHSIAETRLAYNVLIDKNGVITDIFISEDNRSGFTYDYIFYPLALFKVEVTNFVKTFSQLSTEKSFKDGVASALDPEEARLSSSTLPVDILFYITYNSVIARIDPNEVEYNSFGNAFRGSRPIPIINKGILLGLVFGDILI